MQSVNDLFAARCYLCGSRLNVERCGCCKGTVCSDCWGDETHQMSDDKARQQSKFLVEHNIRAFGNVIEQVTRKEQD